MGVKGVNKKGEPVTLLNPNGKGKKYAMELKNKKHYTNDGQVKKYKDTGKDMYLSDKQRAFRVGYLQARQDSADCFNAKRGIKVDYSKRYNRNKNK